MEQSEPKLERPGAGLPFLEYLIARFYFVGYKFPRLPWDAADLLFARETEKTLSAIQGISSEQAGLKILVPRMRGIEDSSRHWSVSMTLEHLIIVGKGISEIMGMLGSNEIPSVKVDISKVKPPGTLLSGKSGAELCDHFSKAMKSIRERIDARVQDRNSKLRHPHPWFGPMTAHQWNWLLAVHQSNHRKQIEKIIALAK